MNIDEASLRRKTPTEYPAPSKTLRIGDLRLTGYCFTATENAVGYPSAQMRDEPNYIPMRYTPAEGGG